MGSKGWVVLALAVACLAAMAGPAQAAWGVPSLLPQTHSGPTDQSWLKDVPEQPGERARGKVAVFTFNGDDALEPVRAAVVRTLRKQRLSVTATLRPADSPRSTARCRVSRTWPCTSMAGSAATATGEPRSSASAAA